MMSELTRKRVLRLALPLLLLTAMLSCLIPSCEAGWLQLTKKAGLEQFPGELAVGRLYIHVIDVGKADAILVESPESSLLIDTGTKDSVDDVTRYLSRRGITALDAVWISHGDSDHTGGLADILQSVPVREIVGSAYNTMPQKTRTVKPGEVAAYGEMTLEVLSPAQCFASENDASVVFLLRYGDFTMLFCGDMEEKAEQALLQSGKSLQADVLKAAHHGSDSSNSRELIDAVKPQYAVISAGRDRNLLPRSTVLKRFEEAGVVCYRTDLDGTVVIAADGELIEIITETTGRSGG